MNIVKYYKDVLKNYALQNISEYETLRFANTTMRNYNVFLNQIKMELKKADVNFNDEDVDKALKKLINQRIAYFNDIKKPVQETKINNNMKRRILSVNEFGLISEKVGINSFDKELSWINTLQAKALDSKELDIELKKVLKSSEDGSKLYIKSIALDYAGLTKWSDKYKAKAEELGFEIKDNEQSNDIKRLKSGNTFNKPGIKQRHINMGEREKGQMPYNKNMEGDFQTGKESKSKKDKKANESKDDLIDFIIPTWALSYIVNNDPSGLEDEDIEKVDKFIDRLVRLYGNGNLMLGNSEGEDNLGFKYRNDIDNMGAECERMYLKPTK